MTEKVEQFTKDVMWLILANSAAAKGGRGGGVLVAWLCSNGNSRGDAGTGPTWLERCDFRKSVGMQKLASQWPSKLVTNVQHLAVSNFEMVADYSHIAVIPQKVSRGKGKVSRSPKAIGHCVVTVQIEAHEICTTDGPLLQYVLSINVATGLQKIQGGRCAGIVFSVHATKYAMQ